MRRAPNTLVEHRGLSTRRDQCDAVSMLCHSAKPIYGYFTEWWVKPYPAAPLLLQTVLFFAVVFLRGFPWPDVVHRRARVQIELAQAGKNFRRSEPFVFAHDWRLMTG